MSTYDFDAVDSTAVDEMALSFPSVQWVNGKKALRQVGGIAFTGGFFFPYEQAGQDAVIPKWERTTRTTGTGKDIEGLGAHLAGITVIRYRRRWTREEDGRMVWRPWGAYEPGFRGHMQAVGFIKGHPSPVCFTWRGNAIQNVISVLREQASKVLAVANREAPEGKKLPLYAFWMGVKAGPHEMVGGGQQSEATLPQIALPKEVTPEHCRQQYVGREILIASQQLYHELASWVTAWDAGQQASPSGYPELNSEADPQGNGNGATAKSIADMVSPKQIRMIKALCRDLGIDPEREALKLYDARLDELSKKAASAFIDDLNGRMRVEHEPPVPQAYNEVVDSDIPF